MRHWMLEKNSARVVARFMIDIAARYIKWFACVVVGMLIMQNIRVHSTLISLIFIGFNHYKYH